jgi:hypothetical protein
VTSVPEEARRLLERGALAYLGVVTPSGPHVTPMVYVLEGGRLWVTPSRASVKARAWRRDGAVSGMVGTEDGWVSFRGRVRTYDVLDPLSWPATVVAGPRLVRAATRFGLKNARFFAGYAADAGRVPLAWMPPGRVFAGIVPAAGRVAGSGGDIVEAWGVWPTGSRYRRSFSEVPPGRGVDLRAPADVRRAVGGSGSGAVGLEGPGGLTVLPARWRRNPRQGTYEAVVARRALELAGTGPESRAALTVDRASTWRASAMSGMLLQGGAELFSPEHAVRGRRSLVERLGDDDAEGNAMSDRALVRIRPDRVVWWRGWSSGSVARRRPGADG